MVIEGDKVGGFVGWGFVQEEEDLKNSQPPPPPPISQNTTADPLPHASSTPFPETTPPDGGIYIEEFVRGGGIVHRSGRLTRGMVSDGGGDVEY